MTTGPSRRVMVAPWVFVLASTVLTLGCRQPGPAHYKFECNHRLRQIAVALGAYHKEHGRYPPAYVSDSKGVPIHSWRVLLLKYLDEEEKALYDLYDFNEPWNGPNNKKLLSKMPYVYGCPSIMYANGKPEQAPRFVANYLALVGPNSPLQGNKSKPKSETFVGSILIAEVADSDILWMEPRDLDVSQVIPGEVDAPFTLPISAKHPSGAAGAIFGERIGAGVILGDERAYRLE